jgi:uncharacterized protein YfaS (alpha-2-macroglobulin family)
MGFPPPESFAQTQGAGAYWSGILPVGRENRNLTFTVPDYFNGRLRIVAIAVSPPVSASLVS